jgi:hypothetical protein
MGGSRHQVGEVLAAWTGSYRAVDLGLVRSTMQGEDSLRCLAASPLAHLDGRTSQRKEADEPPRRTWSRVGIVVTTHLTGLYGRLGASRRRSDCRFARLSAAIVCE